MKSQLRHKFGMFRRGLGRLAGFLLAILLTVPVLSGDYTLTLNETGFRVGVSLPDSYTVITAENLDGREELLSQRGKTLEEIRSFFDEGCLFIALPSSGDFEISLTQMTDTTSQGIVNLMDLTLDEQDRVRILLLGDAIEQGREVRTLERGGALFFRVSDPVEEASQTNRAGAVGGQEKTMYYVTILNGSYLMLSLSDPSGRLQSGVVEQFENIFSSLDFKVTGTALGSEKMKLKVVQTLIWILCVLGIVVVVWLVLSISKEYHRRKREIEWQRKRRPKPRR